MIWSLPRNNHGHASHAIFPNTLLIGNIIEQEFTYNFNWNLGSGLSFVLLVFTLISMGLMSVFDKSEGGTNIW